jgi:hypothetical protein
MAQSFAGLMRAYAHGDAIDMRGMLATIPIALTPVSAFAARRAGAVPAGAAS